ncbi:MAG: DUF418 domain-containing protein [Bacteroides sp.]|nr:DUF418 domain-containing protein [Bacteroides sp.]
MKENLISKPRITVIDALRGFALLGVILVHMNQHYSYRSVGPFEPHEAIFAEWDETASWLIWSVMLGRFINIFAFLFGMSFFIQMDRAAQKGVNFGGRFLWRMILLFVIGLFGTSFYSGDILSIYAVFGIIMLFLNRFKNWILILIAVLLLAGAPRWIMIGYNQLTAPPATEQVVSSENRPQRPSQLVAPEERPTPTFWEVAKDNLTDGTMGKLNYQFIGGNRGYITLAIFILGLVVGRTRFFETVHIRQRRNWKLLGVFVAGLLLSNWLITLFPTQESLWRSMQNGGVPSVSALTVQALSDFSMVLSSAVLAMVFIVLYQYRGFNRVLGQLAPYGRMGLTNYVSQSIVGAILFAMWAYGATFGAWQAAEVMLLGLLVYLVQVIVCKVWLNYFQYGPLEWLWRSLTYFKKQPFLKV